MNIVQLVEKYRKNIAIPRKIHGIWKVIFWKLLADISVNVVRVVIGKQAVRKSSCCHLRGQYEMDSSSEVTATSGTAVRTGCS